MKNRRQTYALHVSEKQMNELQLLVKQERQRMAAEGSKHRDKAARLKGLQAALQRSIYFFNKHNAKTDDSHFSEDER